MPERKRIVAFFFRSDHGREPVRDWLKSLPVQDRRAMGGAIKAAEFGWPIGLPLCRQITGHKGLWEVREFLSDGCIGRIIFVVHGDCMVLLHGFVKKTQKTAQKDIEVARQRQKGLR